MGGCLFGQPSNLGFESYSTLPSCPTNSASNTSITHCNNWTGASLSYPTSCIKTVASGSSSGVQYYNNAGGGGTNNCVMIGAHGGTGYVYFEDYGFYPSSTGMSQYIYQSAGSLTGGSNYLFTGYLNSVNTNASISAWLVPAATCSTATQILTNIQGQTLPVGNGGNGYNWLKINVQLTPPSNGSYYLVIGEPLFCNDGAHTALLKWCLDDCTFGLGALPSCTANAGSNQSNDEACCGGWAAGPGVVIGTTAIANQSYQWSPSNSSLNSYVIAQPTSTASVTTTYTVTVTGTGCNSATSTVTVTAVPYIGSSCCRYMNPSKGKTSFDLPLNFIVFPNPANENVTINFYDNAEYLRIVDMTGKTVFETQSVSAGELTLDVSKYVKGLYFITAKIGNNIEKQKMIVE